jgi:hypothetical protein
MELKKLLEKYQSAKAAAQAAADKKLQLHQAAQNLIQRLDGRLVPTSIHDTGKQLQIFMGKVAPGGNWWIMARDMRAGFLAASLELEEVARQIPEAERSLSTELAMLTSKREAALRAQLDKIVTRLTDLLLPYCDNPDEARQIAAQCPKIQALNFELSAASIPLPLELVAQRFLSNPQTQKQ